MEDWYFSGKFIRNPKVKPQELTIMAFIKSLIERPDLKLI
jgi:hypothetical protein